MTHPEHPLLGARVELLENAEGYAGMSGEVLIVGELASRSDDNLYAVVEVELGDLFELPPVVACPLDRGYFVELEEACHVRA